MVSFNVVQLLKSNAGVVRDFAFEEELPASDELRLVSPVEGRARLMRTANGILVQSDYESEVAVECARCLDEVVVQVGGTVDEEFLATQDLRTGMPVSGEEPDADQPKIDDNHEIVLDDLLRQDILTNLPFQPLCEASCPGLCAVCGQRQDEKHTQHPESDTVQVQADDGVRPFARLAELLNNEASPPDADEPERRPA